MAYHLTSQVNQGNLQIRPITCFDKFSKLGEKKCLVRQKRTFSKIAAPGPTCSGSFQVVLLNKD